MIPQGATAVLLLLAARSIAGCTWEWTNPSTGTVSCYYRVEEGRPFWEAEEYCKATYGGHLVAPSTSEESAFLRDALADLHRDEDGWTSYWLGAYSQNNDPKDWFFTTPHETFKFTDWHAARPSTYKSDRCVSFYGQITQSRNYPFRWTDSTCGYGLMFICEAYEQNENENDWLSFLF